MQYITTYSNRNERTENQEASTNKPSSPSDGSLDLVREVAPASQIVNNMTFKLS
jgi:hypothetical protein